MSLLLIKCFDSPRIIFDFTFDDSHNDERTDSELNFSGGQSQPIHFLHCSSMTFSAHIISQRTKNNTILLPTDTDGAPIIRQSQYDFLIVGSFDFNARRFCGELIVFIAKRMTKRTKI